MFDNFVCFCCNGDEILYECYIFRGHLFRRYPNGFVASASDDDIQAAAHFTW